MGKVALAALLASVVFIGSFWIDYFGLVGVILGSAVFMALFLALLVVFHVPEVDGHAGPAAEDRDGARQTLALSN